MSVRFKFCIRFGLITTQHNIWTTHSSSCTVNEHILQTRSSHIAALRFAKSDGTLAEPARCLTEDLPAAARYIYVDWLRIILDKASQRLVYMACCGYGCIPCV